MGSDVLTSTRRMIDLRLGDCLEALQSMEDNSVDSIVTDPPYGFSFIGIERDPEYYAIAEGRVVQPRREQLSLIA